LIDKAKIEKAVSMILDAIGENPKRPGLVETPRRIAEMYTEFFTGIEMDAKAELSVGFEEGHREMVLLKDIPFYSMCEHHLLPFYGAVHVGYIPNEEGKVVGISKLARVVDIYARRFNALRPDGVAVVIEAVHMCMTMRGIEKPGSAVVTSAMRGTFRSKAATRAEFLSLVKNK
jgi:GTP cyclohydrolase I